MIYSAGRKRVTASAKVYHAAAYERTDVSSRERASRRADFKAGQCRFRRCLIYTAFELIRAFLDYNQYNVRFVINRFFDLSMTRLGSDADEMLRDGNLLHFGKARRGKHAERI